MVNFLVNRCWPVLTNRPKSEKIRGFEGCNSLKLLQDVNKPAIFFTYSVWNSEDDLNNYRHSELFAKVWKATKSKFAGRAEAWSTDLLHAL